MHLLRLAAGALLVLCAGCGLAPTSPAPPTKLLPQEEADFSKSLAHFAHGIILDAELGPKAGSASLDAYRRASALDTTNALLTQIVVGRLWDQGQRDQALAEVQKQTRHNPTPENHTLLAALAENIGKHALAAEHLGKAASLNPDDEQALRKLQLRAWIRAGEDRQALRMLRRLARPKRGAPANFAVPFQWGRHVMKASPDDGRARPYFKLALKSATNAAQRAITHEALASVALQGGKTNCAQRALRCAVRLLPDDPARILNFVRFELAVTGPQVTNDWLRQAKKSRPEPAILLALAQLKSAGGEFAAASAYCQKAHQRLTRRSRREPLHEGFYAFYANCLDEAGHKEKAEKILLEALAIHPESALLQNHLAYFWAVQNVKLEKAEQLVTLALQQYPDNGAFLDTLGWVYYRQARYDDAVKKLLMALKITGDDPTMLDHLGDVHFALGRRQEAIAFWRRSLRLDPTNRAVAQKVEQQAETVVE